MTFDNKRFRQWLVIILMQVYMFFPSLQTFLVQDDFWLLMISKVVSFRDAFILFLPRLDVVWYRPISSQMFFAVGQWWFGFNPLPYHVIVFLTHLLSAWFLYQLLIALKLSRGVGWLSALIYATHQIHTVSLSWLSAYSFILGPLLVVLTILLFLRENYGWAFIIGVICVMTNEVGLLMPFYLLPIIYFYPSRKQIKNWQLVIPYILVSALIVFLRKVVFPTSIVTKLYQADISANTVSTVKFYALRLLGVPLLYNDMPARLQIFILLLVGLLTGVLAWNLVKTWNQEKRTLLLLVYFSGLGLLPFMILPNHLAPHYLSFSLAGFSVILATSMQRVLNIHKWIYFVSIGIFLLLQLLGSQWTYSTHWLFTRAELAKKLIFEGNLDHQVGTEEYYALGANAANNIFSKE